MAHKRWKSYAKGHWTKAAKAARSQAYKERLSLSAASRLMRGPKRKYVKSGLFRKGVSRAGYGLTKLFS
jgi:hypothetical protein